MKSLLTLFLCATATCGFAVDPSDNELALLERDYKKAITIQLEKVSKATPEEKAALTYELAMLYLKDQDQEKAFQVFLETLDDSKACQAKEAYDEVFYKLLYGIYLDPTSPSPQETARKLIKEITPYLVEHPDQQLIKYFAAIGYANLGRYEDFFDYFYQAYLAYPKHYLAYRTKAVLHLKLMERKRSQEERALQRQAVLDNLQQAIEREPQDFTLYKMVISFSPSEKKVESVRRCLNKILDDNIIIPRSDLVFYIQEAMDVKETRLAERFIGRAHEWYPQSRIVEAAQKYIDAQRN